MTILETQDVQELSFRLQSYAAQAAVDRGLILNADRFKVDLVNNLYHQGQVVIRAVIDIATQEDELFQYPAHWWDALLHESKIWKRLFYFYRPKYNKVYARRIYPELAVPDKVKGREFVKFRVVEAPDE